MRRIVFLIVLSAAAVVSPAIAAEKSPIGSPQMSTNNSPEAMTAAKKQGAKAAAKDTKTGVFRILYFGKPWSQGKPLVDAETGYGVQIVAGCIVSRAFVAEVEAYNRTMRDWHAKTKNERPPQKR